MKRKRPFGVTVVALLQAVSAPTAGSSIGFPSLHVESAALNELSTNLLGVAVTLAGLVIALGLWRLRRWAWVAVMLWTGFGLAGALVLYFKGRPDYWIMAEGIITVFYLNQRDVQEAFQRRRGAGVSAE